MKTLKVVFRKDTDTQRIVAFLPESLYFNGVILSYDHFWSHKDYYIKHTKHVEINECDDLITDLWSIYAGYTLLIRKRLILVRK